MPSNGSITYALRACLAFYGFLFIWICFSGKKNVFGKVLNQAIVKSHYHSKHSLNYKLIGCNYLRLIDFIFFKKKTFIIFLFRG
jgi:hypothetical protein